ncbi:MAG: class I SAM-dependent methyltransferase [Bdellovibrionota bacterium]
MVYGLKEISLFLFDLQNKPLNNKKRLHLHTSASRISYFQESHTNMEMRISRSLHNCMDIIMYNLGYLPHGDKSITTLASTTLESFDQAYRLLRPLGWMSVLCYPGHPQGAIETQQVLTWIDNHQNHFELVEKSLGPTPSNLSPIFLLLRSRKTHSFVSDQLIC